ncbi:phosphate-Repressible Phosphate Permease-like protein [Leishmania major strain Friedlin]|uniref:Phosphate transporter n=1 Tax=Leishmania major TaxID=5664 RepID=E9ACJ5_LEIMA|nr:phosphate-Repressible Phosphate Permease-like protein [Leishmania major strain Friedlin]CAG9567276.1 phosphate-Repressible_Phosphate_Permease-like_protein [Leishmania major strain Friedlin]CBZ12012.1 phosphate-Repressible Phosphate Permease-like protein [Leishmania major strain Friedlin]|eukprot:XP_003721726.1 phosphate-Repressible Phosphate Permease-like protein [Leishmania major strain Friedlin]
MIHPYLWIAVVGGFVGFLVACGNGANDLANAFGTSYGSRVLTMLQIVVIAAVCEFSGAVGLGSEVATTMSSGIAKLSTFEDDPYVLMYGFLCTLGATFIWLLVATLANLPVSSHHAVAGGIIGFALVYGGGDAVVWAGRKQAFPYVSGFVPIVISWFVSPLLAGLAAAVLYSMARFLLLERTFAVRLAPYLMPVVVLIVFFLEFIFIFLNAARNRLSWSSGHAAWMAIAVAASVAVLSLGLVPVMKRRIESIRVSGEKCGAEEGCDAVEAMRMKMTGARASSIRTFKTRRQAGEHLMAEKQRRKARKTPANLVKTEPIEEGSNEAEDARAAKKLGLASRLVYGAVVRDESSDVDSPLDENVNGAQGSSDEVDVAHETAIDPKFNYLKYDESGVRMFDPRAEYMFRMLQVVTAACTSLAHGSNDVSNAIGPYAAIYQVYRTGNVASAANVEVWLLCLGGAGIVVGLATFGLPIMRLLGEKLAVLTPVRGCAAEVATALVVSLASSYGIPVSSTHCITGAVLAISMVDIGFRRVCWALVLKMYVGWVFTLIVTAIISACFFAQGIAAPVPRGSR